MYILYYVCVCVCVSVCVCVCVSVFVSVSDSPCNCWTLGLVVPGSTQYIINIQYVHVFVL